MLPSIGVHWPLNWTVAETTKRVAFSRHILRLEYDVSETAPFADPIYTAMRDFRPFDGGHNGTALVYGKRGRNGDYYALFDTKKVFGYLSRLVNPAVVPVRIACDAATREIIGDTAGKHMLIGQRKWSIHVEPGAIRITTEAYERPRGLFNFLGMLVLGRRFQLRIWAAYLQNIASSVDRFHLLQAHFDVDGPHSVDGNPRQPVKPYLGCDCSI